MDCLTTSDSSEIGARTWQDCADGLPRSGGAEWGEPARVGGPVLRKVARLAGKANEYAMQNQFLPPESATETTPYVVSSIMSATGKATETTPAAQAVTDMMAQAQRKVHRRKMKYWATFIALETALIAPAIWTLLHIGHQNPPVTSLFLLLLLLPTLSALGAVFLLSLLPSSFDTETLTRMGGTKAIPILLDSLTANASSRHRKAVLRALTLLLPQMQATDAPLLTPLHRYSLNVMLRQSLLPTLLAGAEYPFALALLKAYEQVGDAKAIPIVVRLANSQPRNERQRAVQQAAADCLPSLRAHVSGVDTTQTLLRAAMPATNTPNTLLRAATATTNAPDDELLRAANPNE
jgi:hypothetical protein